MSPNPSIDWQRLLGALAPGPALAGVGVDVEAAARFEEPARRDGLFTTAEDDYCGSRADPAESYAGTWCAKEAVVKALAGHARLLSRHVEIRRLGDGRPVVCLLGRQGAEAGERFRVEVSISHAEGLAVAVACAVSR